MCLVTLILPSRHMGVILIIQTHPMMERKIKRQRAKGQPVPEASASSFPAVVGGESSPGYRNAPGPRLRAEAPSGAQARLTTCRGDGLTESWFYASLFAFLILNFALPLRASSGTEGAAFLDIPVGAGPAALGAAYTALAHHAYAPTCNPGGLSFLDSTQLAGEHLSYLESIHYEYLSFVHPLTHTLSPTSGGEGVRVRGAIGASVQYLGSGDINGMDASGNPTGSFSSYYAAYNLSYGQALSEKLSLGLTGKLINAKIDDVSAHAYAVDLGSMYKLQPHLTVAATLTNLGS